MTKPTTPAPKGAIPANRMAKSRAERAAREIVQYSTYVHKDDLPAVKSFVALMQQKRNVQKSE